MSRSFKNLNPPRSHVIGKTGPIREGAKKKMVFEPGQLAVQYEWIDQPEKQIVLSLQIEKYAASASTKRR